MDKPTIFTILVAVLQLVIAVISISGKLIQEDIKRLTNRGHFVVGLSILLGYCTIQLFLAQKDESYNSETKLKTELRERDSIYRKTISQERIKYTKIQRDSELDVIKALAKYGLKYDETENKIIKIIENDNKTISSNPDLSIYQITVDSISPNRYDAVFYLLSRYATSYKINFKVNAVALKDYNYSAINYTPTTVLENINLHADQGLHTSPLIITAISNIEEFVFYIQIDYMTENGNLKKLSEFFKYDMKNKKLESPGNLEYLRNFLKSKDILSKD